MGKLIYVGFPYAHHQGLHAGYHHIADTGIYDKFIDCYTEREFWFRAERSRVFHYLAKIKSVVFGSEPIWALIKCCFIAALTKNNTFHFIYGENTYKWIHRFAGKTNKIVCTFHHPATWFASKPIWLKRLKTIDKIILMSKDDVEQFKEWTGKDNVIFIPHGIFTDFYKPDVLVPHERMILMVGNWLRDFEMANRVFTDLLEQDPLLEVNVVSLRENESLLPQQKRLHFHAGITDESLRDLYRRSSILFLPLKQFTANNALLEASATGCHIVVATNQRESSYLNEKQIDIIPLEKEVIENHLKSLLNEPYDRVKAETVRQYVVKNFSWERVGQMTKEFIYN